MVSETEVRVPPDALAEDEGLRRRVARALGVPVRSITHLAVVRRSLDARRPPPAWVLRVRAWVDEAPRPAPPAARPWRDVRGAEPALVVGAGPAGLFAALALLEHGIRPIVLERGRDVRGRRHDVARVNREGVVDPDSNYCFGEGGAGTFSDGKLYTRSTKRGEVRRVLEVLVQHGAPADILVDTHPHVGTNRLPRVVEALRDTILGCGGEVRFGTRVEDLLLASGEVAGVVTADGERLHARAVVLATGHSARDVFTLLVRRGVYLEPKPFAVGVRVEHPQALIDRLQYHHQGAARPADLPPASYSLVRQVEGRGVFSFCMCPGGVICPAATASDEVVVNGWSPSSRRLRFANAGMVVEVRREDLPADAGALAGVHLQATLEHAAFRAGGGGLVAPAQRLVDFTEGRLSADLPACSYPPGLRSVDLAEVLPPAIVAALRGGFRAFGRRVPGYLTNEAVIVGVETRTSAPVRLPRDARWGMHPAARGLFPCGEGAGAAGGIMSAAMDGERAAHALAAWYAAGRPI